MRNFNGDGQALGRLKRDGVPQRQIAYAAGPRQYGTVRDKRNQSHGWKQRADVFLVLDAMDEGLKIRVVNLIEAKT